MRAASECKLLIMISYKGVLKTLICMPRTLHCVFENVPCHVVLGSSWVWEHGAPPNEIAHLQNGGAIKPACSAIFHAIGMRCCRASDNLSKMLQAGCCDAARFKILFICSNCTCTFLILHACLAGRNPLGISSVETSLAWPCGQVSSQSDECMYGTKQYLLPPIPYSGLR